METRLVDHYTLYFARDLRPEEFRQKKPEHDEIKTVRIETVDEMRQAVRNLLTDPELNRETQYYIYLPYEMTKKNRDKAAHEERLNSTVAARTAIYAISNFKFSECISMIKKILAETASVPKDKATAHIYETINKNLQPPSDANQRGPSESYDFLSALHECIHDIKKLKNIDPNFYELFTWIEGLYLNLDVKLRREKIATLGSRLSMQKMQLMEAEEALPAVFVILNELLHLNETQNENHEASKATLLYTLKMFTDSNSVLYLGDLDKGSYLSSKKDEIIPELKSLLEKIPTVRLQSTFITKIEELANWFEGMYQHTATEKDRIGFFDIKAKAVNAGINLILTSKTGLNKLQIAEFYHKAAVLLKGMVKNYKANQNPTVATKVAVTSDPLNAMVTGGKEQAANKKENNSEPSSPELKAENLDDNQAPIKPSKKSSVPGKTKVDVNEIDSQITIALSQDDKVKIPAILLAIESVLNETQEEKFWYKLKKDASSTKEVKIESLYNALKNAFKADPEFRFTQEQRESLEHVLPKTKKSQTGYERNTYLNWLIGDSWSQYLFPRANKLVAESVVTQVEQTENLAKEILDLYEVQDDLINVKKSKELAGKLDDLFYNFYEHLINCVPLAVKIKNELQTPLLQQYATQQHTLFAQSVNMSIQPSSLQSSNHLNPPARGPIPTPTYGGTRK